MTHYMSLIQGNRQILLSRKCQTITFIKLYLNQAVWKRLAHPMEELRHPRLTNHQQHQLKDNYLHQWVDLLFVPEVVSLEQQTEDRKESMMLDP